MRFSRYRLGMRTQNLLGQLKHRTGLGINVLARYALCLSLRDSSVPNPDEFDEKGMEILPGILFGRHEAAYLALMIERLHRDGLDPETYLHRMTRAHINRGAAALHPRIHGLSDFYEMIRQETK